MRDEDFKLAWPNYCNIEVEISWTIPMAHDVLFSGLVNEEDNAAYFYSIVSLVDGQWVSFYIGMTHSQTTSIRNKQEDHVKRLHRLKEAFPALNFLICLGTPKFEKGKGNPDRDTIEALEGLMIFGNWHRDMDNKKKIQHFSSSKQMYLRNTGFAKHLVSELAYGVVFRNT